MKQLKIYFKILYKESLGKFALKKNKQQILLYGILILVFLFMSISFTPSDALIDYRALNDTILLGFLQIFSVSIIAYILVYMSINFSYKLNMFFKTNFLNDINLGVVNKILMIVGVQLVSIVIILIQAGIPLLQVLKLHLFIKFTIMTITGINFIFMPIDILVKYLEKKYYQMDISTSKIRIIILSTLSLLYITVYYTALKVWYNSLNGYNFYNLFSNTNLIYYILILIFSTILVSLYCIKIKNKIVMDTEINNKYKLFLSLDKKSKYTKYLKLLTRNKKMLLIGVFIIGTHILNYFTVADLSIANIFSLFSVVIGINFYSYLVHEKIFLKLYYNKDEYKIYFTLVTVYFILNNLFIILAKNQYIYLFESFTIYLLSIYIGIVFPRENNSLNKFMSNFTLAIIMMVLALSSVAIYSDNIKLGIYISGTVLISIIIIKIIRRIYEKNNTQNTI